MAVVEGSGFGGGVRGWGGIVDIGLVDWSITNGPMGPCCPWVESI